MYRCRVPTGANYVENFVEGTLKTATRRDLHLKCVINSAKCEATANGPQSVRSGQKPTAPLAPVIIKSRCSYYIIMKIFNGEEIEIPMALVSLGAGCIDGAFPAPRCKYLILSFSFSIYLIRKKWFWSPPFPAWRLYGISWIINQVVKNSNEMQLWIMSIKIRWRIWAKNVLYPRYLRLVFFVSVYVSVWNDLWRRKCTAGCSRSR